MTTATTAPTFPLVAGQEVNWVSTIPGLDIEITTEAVVMEVVLGDMIWGDFAWLLIWGDDHLTITYSGEVSTDAYAIALEKLIPTGRTFTTEDLKRIKAHAGIG